MESRSLTSPRLFTNRAVSHHGRNHLYDIEVIEEEELRVKIHYVGYESSSNEWIRKSDIRYKPVPNSPEETPADEASLPLSALASSIKHKLIPSKNLEDPAVRIQLAMNIDTFRLLLQRGKSLGKRRGHEVYGLREYSDLNGLLGEQWHMRVNNTSGDFSYVIKETICYYMAQPKSLLDFHVSTGSSGCLKFPPFFIQQPTAVVFQFVRGDGNKVKLADFI